MKTRLAIMAAIVILALAAAPALATVVQIGTRYDKIDYAGLSTDTKPTSGIKYGSTFYETDTEETYMYTASGWVVKVNTMVGGGTTTVTVTPTVTAGAYHANDIVGGKLTLANAVRVSGGSGVLQGLILVDAAKQKAALEVYLFNADLTVAADNEAEALSAADALKMIGKVSIAVGDYLTLANVAVAMPEFQAFPVKAASGTTLYAFIRTTGTPTYTANCLQLTFGFLRD